MTPVPVEPTPTRSFRRWLGMLLIAALATTGYGMARLRRDFVDFEVDQLAATRVLKAEPLYRDSDGHFQYKYLPAFAIAMIPLAVIDIEAAKAIWYAISVGLLILFVQQSVDGLPARRRRRKTLYWLVGLCIVKFVIYELINGQFNLPLAVLAMAGLEAARRRRPALSGALIAAAVFVKPYALIFVPWLALTLGAPALVSFTALMLAGLLLPIAFYGWSGNLALLAGWFHTVTSTTEPNLELRHAISFAAMWAKWLDPGPAASVAAGVSSVLAVALAFVVWRQRRKTDEPDFLEFSLLLLLIPLLSPQGWDYVLLLGAPAFVCLIDRWTEMRLPWRIATIAGLVLTSLTAYDTVGQRLYMMVTTYAAIGIGAVILVLSVAQVRFRALA
jgi:hypothetical protein